MTTDPGDLVLDPTCGSGTTAYVAEQWGRRWITCDTSRVADHARQAAADDRGVRLLRARPPGRGRRQRLHLQDRPARHAQVIANNPEIKEGMTREQIDAAIAKYADRRRSTTSRDVDKNKARVTGPFTVEAVPAPTVTAAGRDVEHDEHGRRTTIGRPHRRDPAPGRVARRAAQDRHPRQGRADDPLLSRRAAAGGTR